jgi:hypothetical protein
MLRLTGPVSKTLAQLKNMIKLPSYKTAVIFGAIGMPLFLHIWKFLEDKSVNQIVLVIWFIIGFGLPLIISTGDFNYIRQEMRKGRSLLRPWTKSKDFKGFFFPAWKRMFAWFLSAAF